MWRWHVPQPRQHVVAVLLPLAPAAVRHRLCPRSSCMTSVGTPRLVSLPPPPPPTTTSACACTRRARAYLPLVITPPPTTYKTSATSSLVSPPPPFSLVSSPPPPPSLVSPPPPFITTSACARTRRAQACLPLAICPPPTTLVQNERGLILSCCRRPPPPQPALIQDEHSPFSLSPPALVQDKRRPVLSRHRHRYHLLPRSNMKSTDLYCSHHLCSCLFKMSADHVLSITGPLLSSSIHYCTFVTFNIMTIPGSFENIR